MSWIYTSSPPSLLYGVTGELYFYFIFISCFVGYGYIFVFNNFVKVFTSRPPYVKLADVLCSFLHFISRRLTFIVV
jgi:hypothetical protein